MAFIVTKHDSKFCELDTEQPRNNCFRNKINGISSTMGDAASVDLYHIYRKITLEKMVVVEIYEDVIKWKYFPRYWPYVRGI